MRTIQISIPEPCHENWNNMSSREKGRFCDKCCKTVLDFSSKTPLEIQQFIHEHKHEKLCGRFRNDQLGKPVRLEIPYRTLGNHLTASQIFLVSLLFVFGTTLFSCTTPKDEKVDELVLTEVNIPDVPEIVAEPAAKMEMHFANTNDTMTIQLPVVNIIGSQAINAGYGYSTGLYAISYSEIEQPSFQDTSSADKQDTLSANKSEQGDVDKDANKQPNETSLVYPNPAQGVVNLRFNVQDEKDVEAELFDMNGKLIRTLIPSQQMQIGERDIQLNVEGMKPATYLLRLITGDKIETKRVVIL